MDERKKKSDKIAKWGIGVTMGFFGVLFLIGQFSDGFKGIIFIALYFSALFLFLWLVGYLPTWLQVVAFSIVGVLLAFEVLGQWTLVLVAAGIVGGYYIACQYLKSENTKKKAMYTMYVCLFIVLIFSDNF